MTDRQPERKMDKWWTGSPQLCESKRVFTHISSRVEARQHGRATDQAFKHHIAQSRRRLLGAEKLSDVLDRTYQLNLGQLLSRGSQVY